MNDTDVGPIRIFTEKIRISPRNCDVSANAKHNKSFFFVCEMVWVRLRMLNYNAHILRPNLTHTIPPLDRY